MATNEFDDFMGTNDGFGDAADLNQNTNANVDELNFGEDEDAGVAASMDPFAAAGMGMES